MGYTSMMLRKAQQGICARAADASWVANCGLGMYIGPVTIALRAHSAELTDEAAGSVIDEFQRAWAHVRHLSDRNLGRNRPEHVIHPNRELSPILEDYALMLHIVWSGPNEWMRSTETIEARLQTISDTNAHTAHQLLEFNDWLSVEGAQVGFDYKAYESRAVRVGQRYWSETVKHLSSASG